MTPIEDSEIRELIEVNHYRPAVSIIMPIEARINLRTELSHALKIATDKVEKELAENYPDESVRLVMNKLRAIIQGTQFDTRKKSIAIFVSPIFEKIVYLDIPVEEKIMVDESFEIRDLVLNRKMTNKYLVLMTTGKESRIFLANGDGFLKILPREGVSWHALVDDVPEKIANFSDMSERKEILMERFLHEVDSSLDSIFKSYPLPVFILGAERALGHFKKHTKHAGSVVAYIHGNFEEASPTQLKEIIRSHVESWKKTRQKELLALIDEAAGNRKLAAGIREVWHDAMNKKGRLLIVESNFMHAARLGGSKDDIRISTDSPHAVSVIRDAVDDIMEKVLANGGDVEFVDAGMLKDYQQIALIKFY